GRTSRRGRRVRHRRVVLVARASEYRARPAAWSKLLKLLGDLYCRVAERSSGAAPPASWIIVAVRRDLRLPVVLLWLVATGAAFAAAQHLKLEPTPIRGVHVTKLFSPVCECGDRLAAIRFRLRRSDRVSVLITDSAGHVVRHLVAGEQVGKTPVRYTWDGLNDAG